LAKIETPPKAQPKFDPDAEPLDTKRPPLWKDKNLRRVLGANLKQQWKRYAVAAAAMAVVASMTAGTAYMMRFIVDAMTLPEYKDQVLTVAGAVAAIFIVKGIANYVQVVVMAEAGLRIVSNQQTLIFNKLLRQSIDFFHYRESSGIVLRVTRGAAAARSITETVINSYVRDLLTLLGLIGIMLYHQPVLSFAALAVGPFALFGVGGLIKRSRLLSNQELSSMGEIIKIVQETVAGFRIIKVFSAERLLSERMNKAVNDTRERSLSFTRVNALTSPMMDSLSGLAIAGIVCLSAFQVLGMERSTPGEILSFITALLMAYEPAKRLMSTRLQIERNLAAVSGMYQLLDAPETLTEPEDATDIPEGTATIQFNGVCFGYGKKTVLNDLTHTFPAQKITALVGPSGGGKSTMFSLMLRLVDPYQGDVLINGQTLRSATNTSLRKSLSLVSQDTFLFSATIMENLRIGRNDATDDDVIAAAKVANAHEFIMDLPYGYETEIGENGSFLSGGQKQRIAIARAVLKRAPILLLDEATSALDATSEELVRDSLEEIAKGVTMIVIAHRLSSILTADQVCYIEGGEIKENGTLRELLDKKDGLFRALYDKQFREAAMEYGPVDIKSGNFLARTPAN
jgi:ATP-binding cassette subfamily B protein